METLETLNKRITELEDDLDLANKKIEMMLGHSAAHNFFIHQLLNAAFKNNLVNMVELHHQMEEHAPDEQGLLTKMYFEALNDLKELIQENIRNHSSKKKGDDV